MNPAPAEAAGDLESFEMSWDKAAVPLEALERASYALASQLTTAIADAGDAWLTTIYPRDVRNANATPLAHRIRQEVNDQCLRVRISEQTGRIRNLVFALAFSRSGLIDQKPAT